MAQTVMRNRVTTEYKKVERDSEEYYLLRAELHSDGRPRWEQTGEHDLRAFEQRKANDALQATDRGDGDPTPLLGLTGPDRFMAPVRGAPTAGEIEQGAGRAAKAEDPVDPLDQEVLTSRAVDGNIEGTAKVGDPGKEPEVAPLSDFDRNPSSGNSSGGSKSDSADDSDGDNYDSKGVDDLQKEADSRGLEVQGSGNGGRVLKSDLVKALKENDNEKSSPA